MLRKASDNESSEVEGRGELPAAAESYIRGFVAAMPNLDDDQFHAFAEHMGIDPHEAEEVVYQYVRELVGETKQAQHLENVKTPAKFTERELTRALRDAIMAESDAIKQYETVADASANENVSEVLQDIADEEKVHIGELQALLGKLLPDEQRHLDDGKEEVKAAYGLGFTEKYAAMRELLTAKAPEVARHLPCLPLVR